LDESPGPQTTDDVSTRVIATTIRLLAEEGPSAIKARTVADASGLSTMVVYSHFGGIRELLNAVVDEGFKQLCKSFAELPITEDPMADLCSMALQTRSLALQNPHLYDLMFGLSKRATYRPLKDHAGLHRGSSPAFLDAFEHVVASCARLVESGRVVACEPRILAGQLWSSVHGFITLELADHFVGFDDPVTTVLLQLGRNLAVGLGDDPARAGASHGLAAEAHATSVHNHVPTQPARKAHR
jgi:AcrR family transcriptional regulator